MCALLYVHNVVTTVKGERRSQELIPISEQELLLHSSPDLGELKAFVKHYWPERMEVKRTSTRRERNTVFSSLRAQTELIVARRDAELSFHLTVILSLPLCPSRSSPSVLVHSGPKEIERDRVQEERTSQTSPPRRHREPWSAPNTHLLSARSSSTVFSWPENWVSLILFSAQSLDTILSIGNGLLIAVLSRTVQNCLRKLGSRGSPERPSQKEKFEIVKDFLPVFLTQKSDWEKCERWGWEGGITLQNR